jgi:hypothetical protein
MQLAAVHLCDAHYVTDASKYISVLLLSLRAMLHLELPHINVLSKVDLITQYGDLGGFFNTGCTRFSRLNIANDLQTLILTSTQRFKTSLTLKMHFHLQPHDTRR